MNKKTQFNIWYVILAIFGVLFFQNLWIESQQIERLPYSAFEEKLKAGEIRRIYIRQNVIEGECKSAEKEGAKRFVTVRVDPELAPAPGADISREALGADAGTA
jgi:cell division protease FtsH